MESGVDVFNDNLPKYKPSFANRNDSFLEILVQKLGIPIMQNLIHAVIWIRIAK